MLVMLKLPKLVGVISVILIFLAISPVTAETAKIKDFSGTITVNGDVVTEDVSLGVGDEIAVNTTSEQGYRDQLSQDGYADVTFDQGHKARAKNAVFRIQSLGKNVELKLEKGLLLNHVEENQEQDYQISTPQLVAGVRGTKFYVSASFDTTYVCVMSGKVEARKRGLLAMLFGAPAQVQGGKGVKVRRGEDLPDPKTRPNDVKLGWREFQKMGFDIPSSVNIKE